MTCAYQAWTHLTAEHRRRLRVLPSYMLRGPRLMHLADDPRCHQCPKETHE